MKIKKPTRLQGCAQTVGFMLLYFLWSIPLPSVVQHYVQFSILTGVCQ